MRQKHLLFTALLVAGSQLSIGQEVPIEQRIQEIDAKIALNKKSPASISQLLSKDEMKTWSDFYKTDKLNNYRGEGSLFWTLNGITGTYHNAPKAGPYTLSESLGAITRKLYCDDINGEGVLYAIDNDTKELVEVFDNGTTEVVAQVTGLTASHFTTGLTWNSSDDLFYVLTTEAAGSFLYSLDVASGATTLVKEFPEVQVGIWAEFDNENNLYMADVGTDKVFSYNLTSDTFAELGDVGFVISYAQDADFDSETGTLYTAYASVDDNNVYSGGFATVDLTNGAYTVLSTSADFEGVSFSIANELKEGEEVLPTVLTCGDAFVDDGGVDGFYPNGADVVYNFEPSTAGEAVTITFTKAEIEPSTTNGTQDGCWDYLSIYNGPDVNSPVLAATLCGRTGNPPSVASSTLEAGDSFTSTDSSGKLTVTFKSDGSVNYDGWEADVTCAVLAVDDVSASKFNYYPNPTNGLLKVKAKANIEKLELYNVVGEKVLESKPGAQDVTLNMSNLKPGMYILNATVDGKVLSNKVLKK